MKRTITRRRFLQTAAAASTMYSILPSSVLGANEKVNMACIGVGYRGGLIARKICKRDTVNVTALCDVDMGTKETARCEETFAGAKKYQDFRVMFDKMSKEIDAVTVGVPDHAHFPMSILAMSLGKHVYVEKPLAHTFDECERLIAAEKKYGVFCQMGNQGHSGNNYFQFKAWVDAGIIKDVTHVDAYMNNPRRWHEWGDLDSFESQPVPETMDWDTWLMARKSRPYSDKLHEGNWRSWYEFGNGAFGDWGPHTLDTVHRFLKLGLPERVTAVKRVGVKKNIFPMASMIKFDFPARGPGMPAMDITWYDGVENLPPRPKELEDKRKIGACGKMIYSKDMIFMGGTHGDTVRIVPEDKMRELAVSGKLPELPRVFSDHFKNYVLACKGEEKTRSPFEVSGPLTQMFMLGVIAQRLGGSFKFDRKTKQITNNPVANAMLKGPGPRKGWEEFYAL